MASRSERIEELYESSGARDLAEWLVDAEDEKERLKVLVCDRCRGSGIDPEYSYPGCCTPGEEEPPDLEPCTACQYPDAAATAPPGSPPDVGRRGLVGLRTATSGSHATCGATHCGI